MTVGRWPVILVLSCCLGGVSAGQGPDDSLALLRAEIERAIESGVVGDERDMLVDRTFAFAEQAGSRSRFWSAMTMIADLCADGPHVEARRWRRRALEMLVDRFVDAHRWSALLTTRFMPNLEKVPRTEWDREIAAYNAVLDELVGGSRGERVESELLFAKAVLATHVNRRWHWMSEEKRLEAIRDLEAIRARYGDLPCPGSGGATTVGARAARHADELERMHFGAQAPAFSGVDLRENPIDLAEYRGRVVVLDFWTSFCMPCIALVPQTRALLAELEGEPVAFLGVNGDDQREKGLRTSERTGMTWPSVWDGSRGPAGPIATAYHVPEIGWPSVFVLDADGRIRHKLYGAPQVARHLEQAIRALLDEMHRVSPDHARGSGLTPPTS